MSSRPLALAPALLSILGLSAFAFACDRGPGSRHADKDKACPACECSCECEEGGADFDGDLAELSAAANRKMMHGDGQGCLEDLGRIKAAAPKFEARLVMTRAQCMMLVGECQAGKQLVQDYYVREMAMGPGFAAKTAENVAAMRCEGGDSSERDRLLAAYRDLNDAAYLNERDPDYCEQRIAIISELAPKVEPRDVEDTQITGGRQALFHTGAMCFARAGDCPAARAHYREFFPAETLEAIDPALRDKTVRESFDASVELCKGQR